MRPTKPADFSNNSTTHTYTHWISKQQPRVDQKSCLVWRRSVTTTVFSSRTPTRTLVATRFLFRQQEEPAAPATPDWILASADAKAGGGPASVAPASGGGLDWLAHAADPQADVALSATAGSYSADI